MFEDLDQLPLSPPTTLQGDLHLMAGEPALAARIYLGAWKEGELTGLLGYLALEARTLPPEQLSALGLDVLARAREGALSAERTGEVIRLIIVVLALLRDEPRRAGELALDALEIVPEMSAPVCLRSLDGAAQRWAGAGDALWARLRGTESAEERGVLVLKLHHLRALMPGGEDSQPLLDMAAQGGTGALLFMVLEGLDKQNENGQRSDTMPTFLRFLSQHVQDRRERTIFRMRYADELWARGALDDAAEACQSLLEEGPVPVSDLARERLQRVCVAREIWWDAAVIAMERAERCDDISLRLALLVLSLDYLLHSDAPTESFIHVGAKIQDMESHSRQLPPAPFRHAYEVVEGVLLEKGLGAELETHWHRAVKGPGLAGGLRGRSRALPDREIELLVCGWAADADDDREVNTALMERKLLRRLAFVRALHTGNRAGARAILTSGAALSDSEELLHAALVLDDPDETHKNTQRARHTLTERLHNPASPPSLRDLVPLLTLRSIMKRDGESDDALGLFDQVASHPSPDLRAALWTLQGRDLMAAGRSEEALEIARRAFVVAPTNRHVRALLTEAAQDTGDDDALGQLSDFVDDDALQQMLAEAPDQSRKLARAQSLSDEGPDGALEGSRILESLSRQAATSAARAALLRRAAEMAQSAGAASGRAVTLALQAVEIRRHDRLAVRTALDILLSAERDNEAAELLESLGSLGPLSEDLALRLLQSAHRARSMGRDKQAAALYKEALTGLPDYRADEQLDALNALDDLFIEAENPWRWRDLLEHLLSNQPPATLVAEINRRLGEVYEWRLPDRELAIEHYRSALLGDDARAGALEALERLFSEAERYGDLAKILRARVEAARAEGPEGKARLAAYLEALSRVLADKLDQRSEARQVLDEVLIISPRNLPALLKAAELDRVLGRWENLVAILESAARLIEDQHRRSGIYFDIGQVYEMLGQLSLAVENYMVSFICDNRNIHTFERLEELYEDHGRWSELVGIYDVAIDAIRQDPDCGYDGEQLFARKSQIEFYHLERERQAALSLLEALRLNPGAESHARLLETILDGDKAPELLAEAYRLQIDGLQRHAAQRKPLLHQLAKAYERMGNMQPQAIDVYHEILSQWPHDQVAAERIEALCKRLERWDDLVAFYQERLAAAGSPESVIPLYWAIAQVAERKLRDLDLAVRTYEDLLEVIPGNLDVLRALGRLFEATKQWDSLIEVSRREVKLTEAPDKKAHVYFRIGSIYETVHQALDKAIECYESAVTLDARCVPALHGLREIYRRQERWDKVVQTLEREAALWDEPREKASIHTMIADVYRNNLGDLDAAESHVLDALELVSSSLGALRRLLDLHIDRERWAEAAEVALELTRKTEGRPNRERSALFTRRALIARHLGRLEESAASFRVAVDLDPDNLDAIESFLEVVEDPSSAAWEDPDLESFQTELERHLTERDQTAGLVRLTIHRGRLRERSMDIDGALSLYRRAVGLSPLSTTAHRCWADALCRLRRFDEAAAVWSGMLSRLEDIESDDYAEERARAWMEMGDLATDWQRDPGRGLNCYKQALAHTPELPEVLFKAAQCAFLLSKWSDARNFMDSLLAIEDPDASQTLDLDRRPEVAKHTFYMGRILEVGFGDDEQALLAYSRAKTLHPSDIRPVVAAARVLHRQRNWLRLDNLLRGSIQLLEVDHPEEATALRNIAADASAERGDVIRAEIEYRRVLDTAPPEQAREVRLALGELLQKAPGGGAQLPDVVGDMLEADPLDPEALRFAARSRRDRGDEAGSWRLYRLLEATGQLSGEERRALRDLEGRHKTLTQPIPKALRAEALREWAHDPIVRAPLTSGLASIGDTIAAAFSTPASPLPKPPQSPSVVLRDEIAALLGAEGVAERLLPSPAGAEGMGVEALNRALAGHGPSRPLVRVFLGADKSDDPLSMRAEIFALAKGLELLRLGLAPCLALSLADLGHCLEIVSHLHSGGDLEGLEKRGHLRRALTRLINTGLRSHAGRLREGQAILGPAEPILDPAAARTAADKLQRALRIGTDRVGLAVCADIGVAIDAVCAIETGSVFVSLDPAQRLEMAGLGGRVGKLVRFYASEDLVRLFQGQKTPAPPPPP